MILFALMLLCFTAGWLGSRSTTRVLTLLILSAGGRWCLGCALDRWQARGTDWAALRDQLVDLAMKRGRDDPYARIFAGFAAAADDAASLNLYPNMRYEGDLLLSRTPRINERYETLLRSLPGDPPLAAQGAVWNAIRDDLKNLQPTKSEITDACA